MLKKILCLIILISCTAIAYIIAPRPYIVHYHANFAAYIDGKKWDFSPSTYMEEVSRCNITEGVMPEDRIHLHDGKGWLVHVHMAASTWGDLFANLSWGMGMNYIATWYDTIHLTNRNNHLYYILNGKIIMSPVNIPVWSTDRLVVWYGSGSEQEILSKWDSLVDKDAIEYNKKDDPASCSANSYGILAPMLDFIHDRIGHTE